MNAVLLLAVWIVSTSFGLVLGALLSAGRLTDLETENAALWIALFEDEYDGTQMVQEIEDVLESGDDG